MDLPSTVLRHQVKVGVEGTEAGRRGEVLNVTRHNIYSSCKLKSASHYTNVNTLFVIANVGLQTHSSLKHSLQNTKYQSKMLRNACFLNDSGVVFFLLKTHKPLVIFAMFNQVQDRYSDPEPPKTLCVDNKRFEL